MKKIAAVFIIACFVIPAKAQDAVQLYNEGIRLKKEKKAAEAIEKFRQAVALKPAYTEAIYEMGWCYNETRQYKLAIEMLRKARNNWPEVAKVHFELGYAFEKNAAVDSAISCFNECLKLNPTYSGAIKELGNMAYDADQAAKAIEWYDKYQQIKGIEGINDYQFWYRKGFCNNALKNYDSARACLLRSLSYNKDNLNTYLELGFACTKQKLADSAVSYFQEAIRIDPKSHVGYNGIGEVYRDIKKDMQESMYWYNKTLSFNSTERKANFGVGYCLNSTGKYKEAQSYLNTAVQSEPTYTAAYVELGYSYYMTGDDAMAITHLEKAIQLQAKNENARYYLCLVYIHQKDKAKARQIVDELRALNPSKADQLENKVKQL